MRSQLGFSIGSVGKIQGLVEALSYGVKFTSGFFSDLFRKRKLLMLFGFGLIALSKPIIALSSTILMVFAARALDRIGNGIQSTPRDALIGDLSPPDIRGSAFGLRSTLTVAGSAFGAFLAIKLMMWTGGNYRLIFMLAGIPCFLAFIFLWFFVQDPIANEKKESLIKKINIMRKELKLLEKHYWKLILVVFVFMLCRYGEAPLILNAIEKMGLPEHYASTVMVCYNIVTALISYPVGFLSDKIGRERILLLGILCTIIANFIIAHATNLTWMYVGVAFWGAQIGITQTMFFSLISDYAPIHLRGTAFSVFYFVSFIAVLIASHIYEFCVECYGNLSMPFLIGTVFSCAALILTIILLKPKRILKI